MLNNLIVKTNDILISVKSRCGGLACVVMDFRYIHGV